MVQAGVYNSGMIYFWIFCLLLVNLVWLVMVLLNLPGNWFMIGTTLLFAWWQRGVFSWWTLGVVVVLGLVGELIEFVAGMGGAKKAGASWKGALGALGGGLIGGIAGTAVLPVLGTIVGACIGAGLGTWVVERSLGMTMDVSVNRGVGAGMGVLVGIISKFTIGVVIYCILGAAAFIK